MTRGIGLVTLLAALALVGALWALSARSNGPASATATHAETEARRAAAGVNFSQAALQLETFHAANGTYVGATLPASFGVVVARADASSYCLQSGAGGAVEHELGPGGSVVAGGC
ncbi:MAG TPA: hypothetical protein VE269_05565 [Gaiellaceae bacterium]|nr:hypothetical protein [Gaiellaceae bacterium]